MKKSIMLGVFLTSAIAFAYVPTTTDDLIIDQPQQRSSVLLPAEHSMCLNAHMSSMNASCADGTWFYVDEGGRCGCLSSSEVIDHETCDRALIRCNEDAGEIFSQLYQYQNMCGMIQKMRVGCGCYVTDSGMHATAGVR
jgi:hypothetical protein